MATKSCAAALLLSYAIAISSAVPICPIIVSNSTSQLVNLTILENAVQEGAVCLDGSPPAYHFRKGNSSNWNVFLEGGAWCYGNTDRSCAERSKTDLGSSKFMSEQISFTNFFSNSCIENPDFWDWNHVYVRTCDGASFSGDIDQPVSIHTGNKTQLLYYRGHKIWRFLIKDLLEKGMKSAEKAVLSGCSAGGVAVSLLCDEFKDLLPKETAVKCFIDGGFILDLESVHRNRSIRSIMDNIVKEHNVIVGLQRNKISVKEAYKQFFPQYVLPHVKAPVFLLNAAYDTWQIRNVLLYPLSEIKGCVQNYTACNSTQRAIIQGFRNSMLKELKFVLEKHDWGMFINSCFHHCEGGEWNNTRVHNKTISANLGDWVFERRRAKELDHCPFPCNPTCITYYQDEWL